MEEKSSLVPRRGLPVASSMSVLSSGLRYGSGDSGHVGEWLICSQATFLVGPPEPWQPELLKEGDEALKYAVDPVHQPEVDADGL